MKGALIGLLAETSLHPGSEATGGVIDLPVAREGPTGFPVINGSSLKGALRDKAELLWDVSQVEAVFGKPDGAGGVAGTDARLLLLPVRSLTSHYRWVTSPFLLERFQRDCALVGSVSRILEVSSRLSVIIKMCEGRWCAKNPGDPRSLIFAQ